MSDVTEAGSVAPRRTVEAYVVPPAIFAQMIELIRGNVCHRDADAVLKQCTQLQLQALTFPDD